jgi:hypothetical protein
MGVTTKVLEDGSARFEWALAVDVPVFGVQRIGGGAPCAIVLQPPHFMSHALQCGHELAPEQFGHYLDRDEELLA